MAKQIQATVATRLRRRKINRLKKPLEKQRNELENNLAKLREELGPKIQTYEAEIKRVIKKTTRTDKESEPVNKLKSDYACVAKILLKFAKETGCFNVKPILFDQNNYEHRKEEIFYGDWIEPGPNMNFDTDWFREDLNTFVDKCEEFKAPDTKETIKLRFRMSWNYARSLEYLKFYKEYPRVDHNGIIGADEGWPAVFQNAIDNVETTLERKITKINDCHYREKRKDDLRTVTIRYRDQTQEYSLLEARETVRKDKLKLEKVEQEIAKINQTIRKLYNQRRLAAAALPLPHESQTSETSFLPSPGPSAVSLGVIGTAGLCLALVLKRFYHRFTAKPRDSFGFESDSRRESLDAAERMV